MTRPAPVSRLTCPPAGLSTEAAAAYIGVSATLLREMSEKGEAPAPIYIRSRRLYRRAELDAWLAALPSAGEAAEQGASDEWADVAAG